MEGNISSLSSSENLVWKVNNRELYFVQVSYLKWTKNFEGKIEAEFEFLLDDGESICLRSNDGETYIRLLKDSCFTGNNPYSIHYPLYSGTWHYRKSINNNSVVMNPKNKKLWKVDGEDKYFKYVSDEEWIEYENGKEVFSFKFMKEEGDAVYLKKKGWLMYVCIDSKYFRYGECPFSLDKYLFSGTWIDGNIAVIESSNLKNCELWKAEKVELYFKKESDNIWFEYIDGFKENEFKCLKYQFDAVILQKKGKNIFICIDSCSYKKSTNPYKIDEFCLDGTWINSNIVQLSTELVLPSQNLNSPQSTKENETNPTDNKYTQITMITEINKSIVIDCSESDGEIEPI